MTVLQNIKHPILVLIRGLPGSGKTYLTREIAKSLGKEQALVLDPDSIDLTSKKYQEFSDRLAHEGVDKIYHPHRWSRTKAQDAIKDKKIIIWNQPFTSLGGFERTVTHLQNYAHEHGVHLPLLVVEVQVDPEVAKSRIAKRKQSGGHGPSQERFEQFIAEYRSYSSEGYNTLTVYGEDDIAVSTTKALERIKALVQR